MKKTQAVIDLGFGDAGKGTFVACLCSKSKNPIVVRFSGGHQAGHTVVTSEGLRHVFSSFGSGTLQGVPTYWSEHCTFHPGAFLNESRILNKKGIRPIIYVNKKCPITTPCDIKHNKREENKNNHGSCGVGFGATIEREENYYSLTVGDLNFPSVFKLKLHEIAKYYSYYGYSDESLDDFIVDCNESLHFIHIVDKMPNHYNTVIFEGSQGLLLDKNIGFFPHVTRSNVGLQNIRHYHIDNVFYITRAYQTRHGYGPMTNINISHNINENLNETNKLHEYQGEFRRTLLDVDLLNYAIYKDYKCNTNIHTNISLVITCLDHIENEYRFTSKGNIICCDNESEFIDELIRLLSIKLDNVYISKSEKFDNIRMY